MAKRTTMGEAMDLSPEKLRFIHGDAKPQPAASAPMVSSSITPQRVSSAEVSNERVDVADTQEASSTIRRSRSRHSPNSSAPQISVPDSWKVPITTKLEYGTAQALRRAYLQQKLNHATPATQQEIVELAVQDWLRRNGFLMATSKAD